MAPAAESHVNVGGDAADAYLEVAVHELLLNQSSTPVGVLPTRTVFCVVENGVIF